ncbi:MULTISPECIES: response regulator aspartate phosphatase [unclassified Bacillus (in: firmicutes)]|uniref:response regulator aspartate phosphatase n=1 Tax=unclassified Bacillus (in: firmicutes) TaxID=185979 RepID=UPI00041BC3BB|nr:tetratricopeptide repeat protein [Bacillus sp. NSP9.1]QHZ46950.1 tetratricopeptide repeat protein [Bacillus sp. NSP9.1]
MSNESVIPYDLVATKMNQWYTALKNNWSAIAERVKEEVKQELERMEENQDALVYYSLLVFRHELMLDYLYPDTDRDIEKHYKELKENVGSKNLNGMLEYYYHYFMGMYYFRQKELSYSLNFYRLAEKALDSIEGVEIEKADFYFKMAEIHYHMKQTYLSMNYASRAYKIFRRYPTYGVQRVHCQFVIAGNWLDNMRSEEALKNAFQALKESKELNVDYLIGSSHFNVGICYNQLEELGEAEKHFQQALEFYRRGKHSYEPKALFNLSLVKARQNDLVAASQLYKEGNELAKQYENNEIIEKFKMVKGLYLSNDLDMVKETFQFFEKTKMYPDMEWYSILVAELLSSREKYEEAGEYYRKAIAARRQIQRGELLNEI